MRALLRETALLVTSLAGGGTVPDASAFRRRCGKLVDQLSESLVLRGCPEAVQRELLVAQCGVLDEMALRFLPAEARIDWELRPLQVERFAIHDAGRRVIDCIEAHLLEASPDLELLDCYGAILGMGFTGRYAREGRAPRAALAARLNARLGDDHRSIEAPFLTDPAGPRLASGLYRSVPWAIGALACLAAAAVWFAGDRTLDTEFAHGAPALAPAKVAQP